ncbi:MAG: leucine-rich repeat protein, partial [Lachnospiraceae bacterium]|nr:leucine-rich repeat protein [Lachnospiraceae bacterium]
MKNKLKKAVCMSLSLMVLASQFSIGVQADETTGASYEKGSSAETGPAVESGISAFSRETYVVPGGKLYFEPDTGTIAWADGDMEELTIPDEINETPVKLIGRWSLSGLKKLKKINLPGNRNVLGEGSLAELTSLESVVIPKGYDTVPKQCFYGCTSLKKVSMPSTIASIEDMAFYGCSALEYADIPGNCLSVGKMAFYNCTGLKGVAFVEGSECNASAWGIFYNCKSLEKAVNIPGMRFKIFYESGKRAEKWLSEEGMKEKLTEMWRLKYGTDSDAEKWIEGEELNKREKAIRDLAKEITSGCTNDRAKIEAVMQWVDDHLEYERGHDNHPWAIYNGIKEVEAGNKDKQLNSCGGYSNMTQVLLQSLDIPCATFWRDAITGEPMDHEFCAAFFEGKWRWLDTTHSDDRKEGLELDVGTPAFFYDSDHRVDYMLFRNTEGEDIYKELSLEIDIQEDKKDWPDQNPADAYTPGKAAPDPDWVHEEDPDAGKAEEEKVTAREEEFPDDIPESDGGLFIFDKTTGTITGINDKTVTRINIPEKIDGVTVRAIGDGDLEKNTGGLQNIGDLEYLTMPDTITEIGKYALANNHKLKRVHLSANITELKAGTFQNDSSLDTVTIPKKVKRLDKDIFRNCDSLEEALFEDYDFKVKVIETDPLGSDNYYERGMADISWYCFAGMSGRALHGLDFHETYTGTRYHRNLQALELNDDWRDNIVKIHQSQKGYREGFSPYHLDGSNSREFRLSPKAVDYEWGHFAEASKFSGYQPATWCRAFIQWDYAMAGVYGYESREYKWEETVYAGKGGTVELEPGDMLGMGKSHWCMVGSVKDADDGTLEMWIIHGNHGDRKVMDEVLHYNKKTGKALDVEDDDYDEFRAIYKIDFSEIETQTVKLNPGEGKCDRESRIYSKGAYYGCLPEAELDGYVFDGWYTKPGGEGKKAYPYRNLTDDVTELYANYIHDPKAVKGVELDKTTLTIKSGEEA